MAQAMGFGILSSPNTIFKVKSRWMFNIQGISDDGTSALPPQKSARPSLTFKEMEAQHLNETIFFPSKPEWKPMQLTLYDIALANCDNSRAKAVVNWINVVYNANGGTWSPSCNGNFKKNCTLTMFDGCGNTVETWTFENAWPQVVEWGELDMAEASVVTMDITLRYDRAYIVNSDDF